MTPTPEEVRDLIDSTPDTRLVSVVLELMATAWYDGRGIGMSADDRINQTPCPYRNRA